MRKTQFQASSSALRNIHAPQNPNLLLLKRKLTRVDQRPNDIRVAGFAVFGELFFDDVFFAEGGFATEDAEEDDFDFVGGAFDLFHGAEDEGLLVGQHLLGFAVHEHEDLR